MGWTAPVTWAASVALSVARLNEQLRDNLLYLKGLADTHNTQHASGGADVLYYKRQLVWHVAGTLAQGADQDIVPKYRGPTATIIRADAIVETAPTGQDLILDIHKGGTSLWNTNQANRLKVVATQTEGTQTSFDSATLTDGTLLSLDIDQIGSGTEGADLTVLLELKCPVETS